MSAAEADTTAVEHDDDAQAAEEVAETGMKHLTISEEGTSQKSAEEKGSRKPSESGEEKGTIVIDDTKEASTSVKEETGEPTGKPKKKAKLEDQEPPVDLSLYDICKDESGLLQIELWKADKQGNERAIRCVLELFESKSEPKTYLFGARRYPKPGSKVCLRRFLSEAPGDKEREFKKFSSSFRSFTKIDWHQRDSMPSKGPYYFQSPAVPAKKIGNGSNEHNLNEFGGEKKRNGTSSVAVPQKERDGDRQTSSKRKSTFPDKQPAKVFKVTKPLVVGGPAKTTNDGYNTS